ncbi:hypothetical protein IV203_022432 [Nitzschia inconspicua]|uniref:Uncharacterized protein n=1 Tax=Nitzschia inconspicua TaxID=303405 RepID=A0A9K3KJY8_9STRA|nr:hypothetical protein IV203_024591 [Nitzschia inconspicua]KAG7344424.1 hypothetical protein IV203_022432 [Nitzschia inconspicua]
MPIRFSNVEVIELPIIAGPNHPSQRFLAVDLDDEKDRASADDDPALDSACITLGWKPKSRTRIDFETFEQGKGSPTSRAKNGKLQRLSRAVKKRILRQNGVATSDIESEDERISRRKQKKKNDNKKKSKMRIPGTKAVMKTFRSSQDRFSAQPLGDSNLAIPRRSSDGLTSEITDSMPKLPQRCPISPTPTKEEEMIPESLFPKDQKLDEGPLRGDPAKPLTARPNAACNILHFTPISPNISAPQNLKPEHSSPEQPKPKTKRTVKRKIKGAMVTLAKQPAILAKQPVRLAKSTRKRFMKKNNTPSLEQVQQSNETPLQHHVLPTLPPLYVPGESSEDDDDLLIVADESSNCKEILYKPKSKRELLKKHNREGADDEPTPPSTENPKQRTRRSSMEHVATAISILSKQPVKLAKSTRRRLKKRRKAREAKLEAMHESQRSMHCDGSVSSDGSLECYAAYSTRFLPTLDDIFAASNQILEDVDPLVEAGDFPLTVDGTRDRFAAIFSPTAVVVSDKKSRRSSLGYVANAIGSMAYQPVRVPVKFAKKTHKRLRKKRKHKKEVKTQDLVGDSELLNGESTSTETCHELFSLEDKIEFVDGGPLGSSRNSTLEEDPWGNDGNQALPQTTVAISSLTRRTYPSIAYVVPFSGQVTPIVSTTAQVAIQ